MPGSSLTYLRSNAPYSVVCRWGRTARSDLRSLVAAATAGLLAGSGCGFMEDEPSPSGAMLVVLADLTPSGRAAADSQRRHVADVVVPLAQVNDADVVLVRIDDAALTDPQVHGTVSFDAASAGGNEIVARDIRETARRQLIAETDALLAARSDARASDVAGALGWAASTVASSSEGWRGVVVLSDAVSTSPPCNMTLAPPTDTDAAVADCFPAGVPDLGGVHVYFLGATAYAGERPPVAPDVLERFWTEVVQRGGGTVEQFAPTVIGPITSEGG